MRGFRVCLVAVSWVFSPDFCLHVWTFWGVLGARVGVFGGLGVLALVWLGLPCRFFPVSLLTKDRRLEGEVGVMVGAVGGSHRLAHHRS